MDAHGVPAHARWYGPDAGPRDAPEVPAPGPPRGPGQHRAPAGAQLPPRAAATSFGPYRVLLLTLLSACLALAAGVSLVVRLTSHAGQGVAVAATAPTPPQVQAAQVWLSTNLPRSATVIADDAMRAALIAAGFQAAAVTVPGQVAGCAAISFVVVTPALEAAATSDPVLRGCVQSSLPIAVFGRASSAVRVGETVPAGSRALAAQRAVDAHDRRLAGTGLALNPAVRSSAAVLTQLRAGALDLRAATVIAVLAGRTGVHITAVTGEAAEVAAGLPARTVTVALTDAAELPGVLAGLSEAFRPTVMVRSGPDSFRLAWPFTTAPTPTVN